MIISETSDYIEEYSLNTQSKRRIYKTCSNCLYYNTTYKRCKCDNSDIIGSTHTVTNCKSYQINPKYLKYRNL